MRGVLGILGACLHVALILSIIRFEIGAAELVNMNDLYVSMSYDDVDGGVWRQGWDVKYESSSWSTQRPLNVFIMLHSHTDPGWLKTFEQYYTEQTRGILTSTMNSCLQNDKNRFIYAEMSFFSHWWNDASPSQREQMKSVIHKKQFEIVSGGWVMNDEATVHYAAAINQYLEGHEWLRLNVGVKPRASWAIDPFGHSPTMPFLYSKMGFNYSLIQRTHYIVKKQLARSQQLEFMWRQQWENPRSPMPHTPLVHLMPFYAYDIPHTCGPEPAVCSQFDFSRFGSRTPWGTNVEAISDHNVDRKAHKYVDQVRKKASLYRTGDNVLILVGDDFRYVNQDEVDSQVNNYRLLMDYINSKPDTFHVNMKFATLNEYFDAIQHSATQQSKGTSTYRDFFPTLQGDFFTYADVRQEYWAGYFVSRPFWKHKGRDLEAYLRASEIAYVWQRALSPSSEDQARFDRLQYARRASSIFQHHDGMSGTARDHVVLDYGNYLHTSLGHVFESLENTISRLLLPTPDSTVKPPPLKVAEELGSKEKLRLRSVMPIKSQKSIEVVLFNALLQSRLEVVLVLVDSLSVELFDAEGNQVAIQLSPHLDGLLVVPGVYSLHFLADLAGVSLRRYTLRLKDQISKSSLPRRIFTHRLDAAVANALEPFTRAGVSLVVDASELSIANEHLRVTVDSVTGGVTKVQELQGDRSVHPVREDFLMYSSRASGAYLFIPDGEASSFFSGPHKVLAVEGDLVSSLTTEIAPVGHRTIFLYSKAHHIEVRHYTDFTRDDFNAKEFVARFITDIASNTTLYSDLQGLQMKRSKRRSDRPIGFNYYPLTSLAYIQDANRRFSVHTRQPFGTSSLRDGELEVLLDRRLTTDDQKGLGQSCRDNVPLEDVFHLTFERTPMPQADANRFSFPSENSFLQSLFLNHPVRVLFTTESISYGKELVGERALLGPSSELTSNKDVHLIAFKARDPVSNPKEIVAILLRSFTDIPSPNEPPSADVSVSWTAEVAAEVKLSEIKEHSLTLLHEVSSSSDRFSLKPMDLRSFTFKLDKGQGSAFTAPRTSKKPLELPKLPDKLPEKGREKPPKVTQSKPLIKEGKRPGQSDDNSDKDKETLPERKKSVISALPVLQVVAIYVGVIIGLYVILRLVSRKHMVIWFALLFVVASFLQLYVFFA